MTEQRTIRAATEIDVPAIRAIAVDTGLFAEDALGDFDAMLRGYLDGSLEGHAWIVLEQRPGTVVGAAYYAPEPFSDRMWNLYFLGVLPADQGSGAGAALVGHVEAALRQRGEGEARTLIVETSSLGGFEATRRFYQNQGFAEEARIREFYGPGDHKIVFWKSLLAPIME